MILNIVDPTTQVWVDTGAVDPVIGDIETITTNTDSVTGKTTTTIIDTDSSGNVLANVTIIV
jgi:hypothetical protein